MHEYWVDPETPARRFHDRSGPSEKFDFFPKTGKSHCGRSPQAFVNQQNWDQLETKTAR
jgi:hypothetical protein